VKTEPTEAVPGAEKSRVSALDGFLAGGSKNPTVNAALPAVYDELRQLAASYLRRERSDHTLQPTALVHESYLRLLNQKTVDWSNRLEFLSIAARMMRRILSDYATARKADKRGGGAPKVQLDAALDFCSDRAIDIAAVDAALRDLGVMDSRQAQLVELRFFGGLTIEETAEVMALSPATVKREWMTARRWLQRELSAS
jgi:RNA polymerase sigma factor (TIGR02999 family)